MPVSLPIFGFYTIYFRLGNASDIYQIIKADPVWIPFIEKASMAVDCFVGCIRRSGSICYLDLWWYLVLAKFIPSRYSHRILDAARGSSQTSKISNRPLGSMGVFLRLATNGTRYGIGISNIVPPIY